MARIDVLNLESSKVGEVELKDDVFNVAVK